jgi:hypothetical protein
MLAGLILRKLFSYNQENFTGGQPIIPAIAIIEEAQSVLGRNLEESSPFVEWVKEGRKYELGAILVTQQPGSRAAELLSQADNWFSFHLLSEGDAGILGKYNSHYSDDILAHLIGEPIQGNCFMWSAPWQPFVLPVRIRNFEKHFGKHVQKDKSAERIPDTLAQAVAQAAAGALERLAKGLVQKLNEPLTKFFRLPAASTGNREMIGVKSGQLYYLLKEIKTATDTTPEDALKMPLLNQILGEGKVMVAKYDGNEYFCAPEAHWRNAGIVPNTKNAAT